MSELRVGSDGAAKGRTPRHKDIDQHQHSQPEAKGTDDTRKTARTEGQMVFAEPRCLALDGLHIHQDRPAEHPCGVQRQKAEYPRQPAHLRAQQQHQNTQKRMPPVATSRKVIARQSGLS